MRQVETGTSEKEEQRWPPLFFVVKVHAILLFVKEGRAGSYAAMVIFYGVLLVVVVCRPWCPSASQQHSTEERRLHRWISNFLPKETMAAAWAFVYLLYLQPATSGSSVVIRQWWESA